MASIIERVSSLQEKGFKLVDSSQVNTEKSMPFGFPDVVMVADGSVKDAGIDYGVAFLYKENERNDAVHFALPENLTQEQLETLLRVLDAFPREEDEEGGGLVRRATNIVSRPASGDPCGGTKILSAESR